MVVLYPYLSQFFIYSFTLFNLHIFEILKSEFFKKKLRKYIIVVIIKLLYFISEY